MKRTRRLAIGLFGLVLGLSLLSNPAVCPAQDTKDLPVGASLRSAVVDSTIRFVREGYYDSLAGARLADAVRDARDAKRFDRCVTASALCESLTATLRRVVPDGHLRVD